MTPNPTTPAPTTEEWMRSAAREIFGPRDGSLGEAQSAVNDGTIEGFGKMLDLANEWASSIIARHYAAAHPAGTEVTRCGHDLNNGAMVARKDGDYVLWDEHKSAVDSLTTALAEAKARCAELTEKLTDTMDARNVAWLDLAHMKARAETAEARCADFEKLVDTLHMQAAAVMTASYQNTHKSKKDRIAKGHEYWTQCYGDVCVAVDREIRERERAESAEAQRDRMKAALESVEVMEKYSGKAGKRQYGKIANAWLYPGDAIATISISKLKAALSTPPAEEKP